MKKYLIISAVLLVGFFSCTNKSTFVLNVNLQNADGKTVYLQQKVAGETTNVDSALVENGLATLTTTLQTEPEMLYIFIDGMRRPSTFFAENVEIQLNGDVSDLRSFTYSGSVAQDQYNAFGDSLRSYDQQIQNIMPYFPQSDSTPEAKALIDSLTGVYETIDAEKDQYIKNFVTENNKTIVSHYIVLSNSYKYELKELEEIVGNFDNTVVSPFLDNLNERIAVLQRVDIGQPYVDFTMENPDGEQVSLSSLIGSVKAFVG